jgi:hypothetical protein
MVGGGWLDSAKWKRFKVGRGAGKAEGAPTTRLTATVGLEVAPEGGCGGAEDLRPRCPRLRQPGAQRRHNDGLGSSCGGLGWWRLARAASTGTGGRRTTVAASMASGSSSRMA